MYFSAVVIAFRAGVKITDCNYWCVKYDRSGRCRVEFLVRQMLNGRGKGRKRVRDTLHTSSHFSPLRHKRISPFLMTLLSSHVRFMVLKELAEVQTPRARDTTADTYVRFVVLKNWQKSANSVRWCFRGVVSSRLLRSVIILKILSEGGSSNSARWCSRRVMSSRLLRILKILSEADNCPPQGSHVVIYVWYFIL